MIELHILWHNAQQPWIVATGAILRRRHHSIVVDNAVAHHELHVVCQCGGSHSRTCIGTVVLDDAVVHLYRCSIEQKHTCTGVYCRVLGSVAACHGNSVERHVSTILHAHRMIRVAAERSDSITSVKLGAAVLYVAVGIGRRSVG